MIDDFDLRSRLRALPGELGPRRFGRVPDVVRAGARRRRVRARLAAGLVVVLAGVGIPLGVLAGVSGGGATRAGVAAMPSGSAFGGVAVSWLPAGASHLSSVRHTQAGSSAGAQVSLPRLTFATVGSGSSSYYAREYAVRGVSVAGVPGSVADHLWVTVSWRPAGDAGTVARIAGGLPELAQQQLLGTVTTSPRTVRGAAAVLAVDDLATVPADSDDRSAFADGRRFDSVLIWTTPAGATLAVESLTVGPADPGVLQRVADGLVAATAPPVATGVVVPDGATSVAVRAAFRDAFSGAVPASRFAGAVQDGGALAATRGQVFARFPGLAATLAVGVGALRQVDADIVTTTVTVTFTDPSFSAGGVTTYQVSGQATRVAGVWMVSRATFCGAVDQLGQPGLGCPPA